MQEAQAVSIEWWIYPLVLAVLLVVTWLLNIFVKRAADDDSPARRHGVATLFLGLDGRTSTSKLQAFLWTYAVLWALISLLTGAGVEAFNDILNHDPREEYLLLLGGPYAAAIAAKAITTQQVTKGLTTKPPKATRKGTASERVVEIVANDEGALDLGDFQYFAFTLLALTYFAWALIRTPADGLPPIPATLLVLTGVSLGAYVGKKALPK